MEDTTKKHRDLVESVHRFNEIGQKTPPDGTFNADRAGFYVGCMCEELAETINAIAYGTTTPKQQEHLRGHAVVLDRLGKVFKQGLHRGDVLRSDREGLMDGCIDVLVVTLGALAYQSGDYRHAIDEVLNANDRKIPNGTVKHDENGKIVKPDGWVGPRIAPYVVRPYD